MKLIETAIVLLIITFSLSYCLKWQDMAFKKQTSIKCISEGHKKNSAKYKKCMKDGDKPIAKRAIEMKKQARDVKDLMNNRDLQIKKNLKRNY